jgi:hypothetical protein
MTSIVLRSHTRGDPRKQDKLTWEKRHAQQEGIIISEWTEDAKQAKRAQYGEAEKRRLGSRCAKEHQIR